MTELSSLPLSVVSDIRDALKTIAAELPRLTEALTEQRAMSRAGRALYDLESHKRRGKR